MGQKKLANVFQTQLSEILTSVVDGGARGGSKEQQTSPGLKGLDVELQP